MKPVLTQLVNQFEKRHQRLPSEIVVHPVALTSLALKKSVAPMWSGIPVRCRVVKPVADPTKLKLGITVIDGALRGFDL